MQPVQFSRRVLSIEVRGVTYIERLKLSLLRSRWLSGTGGGGLCGITTLFAGFMLIRGCCIQKTFTDTFIDTFTDTFTDSKQGTFTCFVHSKAHAMQCRVMLYL